MLTRESDANVSPGRIFNPLVVFGGWAAKFTQIVPVSELF